MAVKLPKLRLNGDGRAFAVAPNSGGKRQYFGAFGTPEVETAYREWLGNVLLASLQATPPPQKLSTQDVAAVYLQYLLSEYGKGARYSRARTAVRYLSAAVGTLPASQIGPRVLLGVQDMLCSATFTKSQVTRPYTRTNINKLIAEIKRLVKWASARELIPPETYSRLLPVESLRARRGRETEPVSPVLLTTLQATLPFLHEPVRTITQVQYLCGMRPGEVCGMRKGWIRPMQGDEKSLLYMPVVHKNAHRNQRLIKAIPSVAVHLMQPFLKQATDYVFTTPGTEKPYRRDSYRNAVVRASKRAVKEGVIESEWSPNQMRHGIATEIREAHGQEAAQLYLGHRYLDNHHDLCRANSEGGAASGRDTQQHFVCRHELCCCGREQ